jgi:hypothetical protein
MVTPSVTAASKGPLTSRQKLVLQPLDQQWQPQTNQYYPAITTISSEQRPDGQNRVYVETFLIDAVSAPNKKGWRVSYDNPEDFDSRVQASKNHPLVLFQTPHPTKDGEMIFDHPVAPITTLEAAADPLRATIEFQKKYTIGYARHFKKVKDGIWHAVYEITNPKAKKFFQKAKEKGLKLFTSPHIVRPASEPDRTNIREWALIHNAIVSNPAHNEAIASIKDVKAVSSRYPVDFSSLFASLDTPDSDETELDAGYLLEIYTNQLITSHDNNSENLTNMAESASINAVNTPNEANLTSPQLNTATNFNPVTNQTEESKIPQSSGPKEVSQNVENQQEQQQKQDQKQQGSEIEQLKAQLETLQKQNQDLQQKYAQDTRKAQIEKLFAPVVSLIYADQKTGLLNEKEYNQEITRLTKSNHTVEEISELIQARYIMAQYNSAKDPKNRVERASFTSQETESASYPYTKMSTTTQKDQQAAVVFNNSIGLNVLRKIQGGLL